MNILFVCTGNTCRSPMAEAVAKLIAKNMELNISAFSAGTYAQSGMAASAGAQSAIALAGGDLSGHRATPLTPDIIAEADLILCMGKSHLSRVLEYAPDAAEKAHTLLGYATGTDADIDDPFGGDDEIYGECLAQIGEAVRKALEKIKPKEME